MGTKSKQKKWLKTLYKYLFEFIVVFSGVFLAFWLTERQDQNKILQQQQDIYLAVYEDLQSFYESGVRENKKGFVVFFEQRDQKLDSLIAIKSIPLRMSFHGDYWKMPIIESLIQSGTMNEVDIATFKKIARMHTVHQNFLKRIEDFNLYYDKYVTADYDQGMDHFYQPGTNQLKPKYLYLENALKEISSFAELLTKISGELAIDIKTHHLE